MKIGDFVRCRATQQMGLIVGIATHLNIEWGWKVLFPEGIREENGGYLELVRAE